MKVKDAAQGSKGLVALSLISVYFIWGSTYLALRFGLEGLPPFLLNGLRFIIAGALIYPLARLSGAPRPDHRQVWNATRMGVLLLVGG
ncbi:MAG: EamA family transporter, partial [Acidimicrobiia bacterium]